LQNMDLDNLPIKLPQTVSTLELVNVSSSKQMLFPDLMHLETVYFLNMDIGDILNYLPTFIKTFYLFDTIFSKVVSLAAFQNLHKVFMKDTCMSVPHLIRMMEELEQLPKSSCV